MVVQHNMQAMNANRMLNITVNTKELREKIHLLTYAWFRAKHYNTQKDSASLSAFFLLCS